MTVFKTHAIYLTPAELADLFTEMDGEQQAEFFGQIIKQTGDWPGAGWCQQSYSIVQAMDRDAIEAIRTLASHLPREDVEWIVAASGEGAA